MTPVSDIILYVLIAFFVLQVTIGVFIIPFFRKKRHDKQIEEQKQLLKEIRAGHQILLTSGIFGTVVEKNKEYFLIKIADKCVIKVNPDAILGFFDEKLAQKIRAKNQPPKSNQKKNKR